MHSQMSKFPFTITITKHQHACWMEVVGPLLRNQPFNVGLIVVKVWPCRLSFPDWKGSSPFQLMHNSFQSALINCFPYFGNLVNALVYNERLWWVDPVVFGLNSSLATFLTDQDSQHGTCWDVPLTYLSVPLVA